MGDSSMAKNYGRAPLWQWLVLYVIVGAAVYGAIYYFMSYSQGGAEKINNFDSATNSTPDSAQSSGGGFHY